MRASIVLLASLLLLLSTAYADDGVVSMESAHDVATTVDRLEAALAEKGMTVFARIDHAAGARGVGETLRPTQLLIFGNPKVGTPLMQCGQGIAIDLPQKALAWEDAAGKVWLGYNDPHYLAARHGIEADCAEVIERVEKALATFTRAATAP